jgi:micrococcal nuclease
VRPPPRAARPALAAALALVALATMGLPARAERPSTPPTGAAVDAEERRVVRASDGDTIVLEGGERVRLIGVDTPEIHHPNARVRDFAAAAARFTRDRTVGRAVRLEFEPGPREDRYGRTLAYVFLPDGEFLNLAIVREGYGFAYTRFPFAYRAEFKRAETEARRARRGLWADLGNDARRNAR